MSPVLRVLLVITRMELGGAQRVVLHIARHLDREGFRVGLAWGPGDVLDAEARSLDDVERIELAGLVRPPRPGADLGALSRLRGEIRRWRPDVVHTHSSKAGILGRLAARLESVPRVIHTIHGFGFTPLQPLPLRAAYLAAERLAARWTHHFVAVARANARLGVELGLFRPEEVSVIRAGVPLSRFRRQADGAGVRRRLGLPEAGPLVVQVGNFKPQKAPLDFVRVAAEVLKRIPDARFVAVGDGPLRTEADALAARLGVGDRLLLPGWLDDVPGLLAAAWVSVLTSRHEGLPCAVVESLASGTPVVATAVDGTVEVVRDGVNGFLVPPGDVATTAARVVELLADGDVRSRLARAAGQDLEDFDIDRMVRRHEELYRWLTAGARS